MRFLVLIIVSLVLASSVIFLMLGKKPAPKIQDGHFVLISKVDIPAGTFVNVDAQFAWQDVTDGKFKPEEMKRFLRKDSTNPAELNGAVARSFIAAGEPITTAKIVTPKEGGFMSAVLYPGMRAVSVGVTLVSGNAGFIFPGDRVDILLTHKMEDSSGEQNFATETFIQDVRVLAIDQKTNNPEKQAVIAKTVTLEVTPKQAEKILVAEELGKISLVLRSMSSAKVTLNTDEAIDANEEIGDEITIPTPPLGFDGAKPDRGYTKSDEISRISRPRAVSSGVVTVTRGKTTTKVIIDSTGQVTSEESVTAITNQPAAN